LKEFTAKEFIARERQRFANSPIDPHQALLLLRLFLQDFADHLYLARLADGQRLNDVTDSAAYVRELAAVIEFEEMGASRRRLTDLNKSCPRCGHVHKSGEKECGEDMGGAGVCKCDVEVSA
jgi:hypothetical protein